ncbi:hypothetical protein [Corynebacterium stationis]|nr:hypothetical protein [Corynebacterium stationis]
MRNNNFEQIFGAGVKLKELAEHFVDQSCRAPIAAGAVPVAKII